VSVDGIATPRRGSRDIRAESWSPERREVLERRLAGRCPPAAASDAIARRSNPAIAPLSFQQERLWFLHQLEPHTPAYNIQSVISLTGALDVRLVEAAVAVVVARHETLRTSFGLRDGEPVEEVRPPVRVVLDVVDFTGLATGARFAAVERLAAEEAYRPFELSQAPLFRLCIGRLAVLEHVVALTVHHIVSDYRSLEIFFAEMVTAYSALRAARPVALPELAVQYGDFAHWQRRTIAGDVLQRLLAYWTERLAGAPRALEMPTDRARPARPTFRGAWSTRELPPPVVEAIRRCARREGVTDVMVALTAFEALVHRYTGETDIVIGAPVTSRPRPETEHLIGFFVNAVPLRTDLRGDPTFRELLGRVRDATVNAYAHRDLPFERLVEALRLPRDLSRPPLFQVMFNGLPPPDEVRRIDGLEARAWVANEAPARFDLTVYFTDVPDGIRMTVGYSPELFDRTTVDRMLTHLELVFEAVTAEPDVRLSALRLPVPQPATGFAEVSGQGGVTRRADRARGTSIADAFALSARRHADRVAVRTPDRALTYAELDHTTTDQARRLLAACGAAGRIAVLSDDPVLALLGILSVLRSGNAYVPLDPLAPAARLTDVVADAEPSAIVTDAANATLARRIAGGERAILRLEDASEIPTATAISASVPPEAAAYILYTSGSTGRPKGVLQTHANVVAFIRRYTEALAVAPHDRLTLLASYGVDAAVMDVFGALLAGATLYPWPVLRRGLVGLADWLRAEHVTIYHSTPTLLRHLLGALGTAERLDSLRCVVLGGEPAYRADIDTLRPHIDRRCVVVNGLGPTESTLALQYFVSGDRALSRATVPVGAAVEGTDAVVLTPGGEAIVGPGVGELGIIGRHVAPGYWRRPDLTAERFRPVPDWPDARLYLTGDVVRRLPDGVIEYVGRRDDVVKVRGVRIELADVETTLRALPGVAHAAVAVFEPTPGGTELAAYVVPRAGGALDVRALSRAVRERLPDAMVPSAVITIHALPLTPSGKIDRRALPPPASTATPATTAAVEPPRTEMERRIAAVWAEVLGTDLIDVTRSFFEHGGNSLLLLRLHARLHQLGFVDLSVIDLFRHRTVQALSARLT
jgi:amino acid adenylation domain-containing protein